MDAKKIIKEWNKKTNGCSPDVISYDLISLVEYTINKTKNYVIEKIIVFAKDIKPSEVKQNEKTK